jgi:hypothetical protein
MPQSAANRFTELISDIHSYNVKNDVMIDAVNAALTTDGENQLILQNIKGTEEVAKLSDGFQPLGIAVHKNIAYIISASFDNNGNFITGEIGTFPSPNWDILNGNSLSSSTNQNFLPLLPVYKPLHNFISGELNNLTFTGDLLNLLPPGFVSTPITVNNFLNTTLNDDSNYKFPFRSNKFDFKVDSLIEIELQEDYDNSINIIFTNSNNNPLRLVNSRFILSDDGKSAALANRRQSKDTNTYSDTRFLSTRLIKSSDIIPKLDFIGVFEGGFFTGGNYKFYFVYADNDGSITDIVEESRMVTISNLGYGVKSDTNTGKYVQFKLSNLDKKFNTLRVYYSFNSGDISSVSNLKEIQNIYSLPINEDYININFYGNELTEDIDPVKLNVNYSSINTVKTITQHDDRLIPANIKNSNTDLDLLKDISSLIPIFESDSPMKIKGIGNGYSDPFNVYNNLGVWSGETYEIGIVYILTKGRGLTPSFPIRGIDNFENNAIYDTNLMVYNPSIVNTHNSIINDLDGFSTKNSNAILYKENRLGVYRTSKKKQVLIPKNPSSGDYSSDSSMIRFLNPDHKILIDPNSPYRFFLDNEVEGFFYVRKERKKDCIIQGYITNTIGVNVTPVTNNVGPDYYYNRLTPPESYHLDGKTVFDISESNFMGKDFNVAHKFKIIPAPGRILELALTTKDPISNSYIQFPSLTPAVPPSLIPDFSSNNTTLFCQGRVLPPPDAWDLNDMFYAFYSPDSLVDSVSIASQFNNSLKGISVNSYPVLMSNNLDPLVTNSAFYDKQNMPTVLEPIAKIGATFDPIKTKGTGSNLDTTQKYFSYINEYQDAYSSYQFSSVASRNIYAISSKIAGNNIYGLKPDYSPLNYPDSSNVMFLANDNIRFGDYIGIRITATEATKNLSVPVNVVDPLWGQLHNDISLVTNYRGITPTGTSPTGTSQFFDRMSEFNFAVQANIYDSPTGAIPFTGNFWKNKYSNKDESAYFAVSSRISLKDAKLLSSSVKLSGGDCFINFTYKRAWYPLGIEGVPTATDPSSYIQNNKDTGLTNRGMLFPIVCESNHNTSLRNFEEVDLVEKALYGKNRTFYPIDNIKQLRESKQLESKGYNFGYSQNNSDKTFNSLSDSAPAFSLDYNTRILLSAPAISGSFKNGYNDFSNLNFRDYTKHLGAITKLISQAGTLFCVQENGVSVVPMNQRTMVSPQQGGVYIDDGQLLGQKLLIISSEYGSDQQFSVIKTDTTIYGCSFNKNKIWRIEGGKDSYNLNTISDFKIQKILNKFKARCLNNDNKNYKPFVKSSFDRRTNTVIFTYFVVFNDNYTTDRIEDINNTKQFSKEIGSVYYNETLQKWISTYSWDPMFMFNLENELYSLNSKKDKNKIWRHFADDKIATNNVTNKTIPTCNIYGNQEKFEFEFVLNENSLVQKILNNLIVVCNRQFPNRIILSIEDDVDFDESFGSLNLRNSSYSELLKQRVEEFKYIPLGVVNIIGNDELEFDTEANSPLLQFSIEEAERIEGAYFNYLGVDYVIGTSRKVGNRIYMTILNNILNITTIPPGLVIKTLNFGLIKQNMEYIEDHLYIEVGRNNRDINNMDYSLIRDKSIKIKMKYEGMNYITVQQIVSLFDYSFS